MSDRVDSAVIERIVGIPRHPTDHYGRATPSNRIFYIMHSQQCLDSVPDLRDCEFSRALDRGLGAEYWVANAPFRLRIKEGRVVSDE